MSRVHPFGIWHSHCILDDGFHFRAGISGFISDGEGIVSDSASEEGVVEPF